MGSCQMSDGSTAELLTEGVTNYKLRYMLIHLVQASDVSVYCSNSLSLTMVSTHISVSVGLSISQDIQKRT